MKKKTKSKSNNNSSIFSGKIFWVSIIILLLCALFHFALFFKSFFRSLSKLNEEPIATITFKHKVAQRKFLGRNIWDRLKQNSLIYDGDTIHTAPQSEATIWFSDGNVMELSESAMAQVFLSDSGVSAQVEGGNVLFDSSDAQNGITLKTEGAVFKIESGSEFSAKIENGKKASVQLLKGNAQVSSGAEAKKIEAGGAALILNEGEISQNDFFVLSPTPHQKFLYHTEGKFSVPFFVKSKTNQNVTLKIFSDKNFHSLIEEKKINFQNDSNNLDATTEDFLEGKTNANLSAGIYYWKIFYGETEDSGKIQIFQALPPVLISPVEDYKYSFRKKNPAVRLIWSEADTATSYKIEIARDQNFSDIVFSARSQSASLILSTLSEGKYFWRIEPFFTINKTGFSAQSDFSTFTIEKKSELKNPVLLFPKDAAMIDTEVATNSFSWKADSDAFEYKITASKNEDLSNPFLSKKTSENFLKIENPKIFPEGKWFWAVYAMDEEGSQSEISEIRYAFSVKGKVEQRTIEPQDNYKISRSLLSDTKFTYKKNLPENFLSEIQVARDKDFKNIIFQVAATGQSIFLPNLEEGVYFWKLKSQNLDTIFETDVKKFEVAPNLDAAKIIFPKKENPRIVLREGLKEKFSWEQVLGADFYKFSILSEDEKQLLFDETVYDCECEVEMFGKNFLDGKNYKAKVQAFAMEIPGVQSRRNGNLSERIFLIRNLRPVSIDFPKQNATIFGIDALINPPSARWSAVDEVGEARFFLYKIEGRKEKEILRIPSDQDFKIGNKIAPQKIKLKTDEDLTEGTYKIVIHAKTLDGVDISTDKKNARTFKILSIPKLSASENLLTNPKIFNVEYLLNPENERAINLSWGKVKNATEYELKIFKKNGTNQILALEKTLSENSFKIDFSQINKNEFLIFSRGDFVWTIEAKNRRDTDGDGVLDKLVQEGKIARAEFKTDIPLPKKTQNSGAVNPYGQ